MAARTGQGKATHRRGRSARPRPSRDLGDRAREVVHDLRQPVVCISALVASARASVGPDADLSWQLDGIDRQVGVLLATVASLLDADAADQAAAPLGACAAEVVASARIAAPEVRIVAGRGLASAPSVRGAPVNVRRALANVVDNATRAAGPGGLVQVSALRDGGWVRVVVEDDGPGFGNVAPQHMIGLRSAVGCLETAGGSLQVGGSATLGGARVVLTLVAADAAGGRRAAPGL